MSASSIGLRAGSAADARCTHPLPMPARRYACHRSPPAARRRKGRRTATLGKASRGFRPLYLLDKKASPMSTTASDVLVETLLAWGVDTVFGIPGDGINGIIEAFRKRQDKIRFIQVRHEEAAAFAACGNAKFTGRLGVCVATSGPGGIHLLNGLYDAKLDGVPVLAITGLQFHDLLNTGTQQDVELDKLFMDV